MIMYDLMYYDTLMDKHNGCMYEHYGHNVCMIDIDIYDGLTFMDMDVYIFLYLWNGYAWMFTHDIMDAM